jgi:hypothetical protein
VAAAGLPLGAGAGWAEAARAVKAISDRSKKYFFVNLSIFSPLGSDSSHSKHFNSERSG